MQIVANKHYFHINSNANLSPHPIMSCGDVLEIGGQTNPFFRFYEVYQRVYPVTNIDTKVVEQVPALKFLRCVRDGIVTSDILPTIAYDTANHFLMLARELVWENIRLTEFPEAPSRQRCIWLIESFDDVKTWAKRVGLNSNTLSVVKVRATGHAHGVDANCLAGDSEPLPIWFDKARDYWSGKTTDAPALEVLFEGTLQVEEIVNPCDWQA